MQELIYLLNILWRIHQWIMAIYRIQLQLTYCIGEVTFCAVVLSKSCDSMRLVRKSKSKSL